MRREAPLHLAAMAVIAASSVYLLHELPGLPAWRAWAAAGLLGLLIAAWAGLLLLRLRPGAAAGRGEHPWEAQGQAIVWMINGALIGGFWLCMPYADPELRMATVLYHCATVTGQVLGIGQRRATRRPIAYAPMALLVSSAVYYAVYWERWSGLMIVFLVGYALVSRGMAQALERTVERMLAARQAAEAALAQVAAERDAKTRFLTSASHDLGQPLQAARLFFDQAQRSKTAAQRRAANDRLRWALDATEQILRQILEHLRLEGGTVRPKLAATPAGPLIARVAELSEPAARLAQVELIALPTRLVVQADAGLTERALGNLVTNAIRHAKARRVLIGARRAGGRVRLWVVDDGVGVADADAGRLFEDFQQGAHGDEVRGGFGLGLASARRMADLMGGAVGLEGRWRTGAAFWLELDAAA